MIGYAMAALNRLAALKIDKLKKGRHGDGGGLYVNVTATGSRSWVFVWKGKHWATLDNPTGRREMGLGKFPDVSLADARELAGECRTLVAARIDPKGKRDADRSREAPKTFEQVGHEYIDLKESGWRNDKHKAQWRKTVDDYCNAIKGRPIAEINKQDVLAVINPLWGIKHETARRVLNRMKNILDYAAAHEMRTAVNPADLNVIKHLTKPLLPNANRVKHHAALDYAELPVFFARVQTWDALAAKALTLVILTATRTSEALNAEWREFDLDQGVWIIPESRMKMQKPHVVPLPGTAVSILKELYEVRTSNLVFPGQSRGKPLSNMSMLMLLRRHKITGVTPHGFRSTFRDWVQDKTTFESRIAEAALAHSNPDKVEAAYLRSSAFEKRKALMQAWCNYCEENEAANVVNLHG